MQETYSTLDELMRARAAGPATFPSRKLTREFARKCLALLFPHLNEELLAGKQLGEEISSLFTRIVEPVASHIESDVPTVRANFMQRLPLLHRTLVEDAIGIVQGDPAAKGFDEVVLAYPGFLAIAIFRIAHVLHREGVPLVPRMLTEYAHAVTGIDIHPGATIGSSFVIDHGTGVVIGETTVIQDRVKIYQGVTLGALSVEKALANQKRHPTIEDDVVIYANATILGGGTLVGAGSTIGGNVWLTSSVPSGSVVYHRAELNVKQP